MWTGASECSSRSVARATARSCSVALALAGRLGRRPVPELGVGPGAGQRARQRVLQRVEDHERERVAGQPQPARLHDREAVRERLAEPGRRGVREPRRVDGGDARRGQQVLGALAQREASRAAPAAAARTAGGRAPSRSASSAICAEAHDPAAPARHVPCRAPAVASPGIGHASQTYPRPVGGEAQRLVGDQGDDHGARHGQRGERLELGPERHAGGRQRRGHEPLAAQRADVAQPERDVREQVERDAAEQRGRRLELQRLVDVAHHLLDAEREQLDAGDHRQVQVGERVARQRVARDAVQLPQAPLRDRGDDVEVRPPQARGGDQREHGGDRDRGVERLVAGADPDRDDRLAERDDHDQREALGEVGGVHAVARHAAHERPAVVDRQRGHPQGGLQRAVGERGGDQEQRPDGRGRQQARRPRRAPPPPRGSPPSRGRGAPSASPGRRARRAARGRRTRRAPRARRAPSPPSPRTRPAAPAGPRPPRGWSATRRPPSPTTARPARAAPGRSTSTRGRAPSGSSRA